jgi:hypothetical protein
MFEIKVAEKIRTRVLCSVAFSRKSCCLGDNVAKYGGARGAADDMTHVLCMLDSEGYTAASTRSRLCTHTHPSSLHTHTLSLSLSLSHTHTHTHTHTEKYLIPFAFSLQQWLHELSSSLRYVYIACLVNVDVDVFLCFAVCLLVSYLVEKVTVFAKI